MSVDTINATAAAGVDPTRARIAGSIKQAASTTGASFEYLLATAKMESNFNPKAAASTSSARGLFQFIDQTWLGTVKEAGAHLGYGKYADAITKNPSGSYSVSDPEARAAIMKLRDDPDAASSMAAVLTQSNGFKLTGKIGRRPTDAELYMAHFMGVGGAGKLIQNAEDNPNASAANMFPNAAAANQSIFYDRSGQARSVSQVYSVLNTRYEAAAKQEIASRQQLKAAEAEFNSAEKPRVSRLDIETGTEHSRRVVGAVQCHLAVDDGAAGDLEQVGHRRTRHRLAEHAAGGEEIIRHQSRRAHRLPVDVAVIDNFDGRIMRLDRLGHPLGGERRFRRRHVARELHGDLAFDADPDEIGGREPHAAAVHAFFNHAAAAGMGNVEILLHHRAGAADLVADHGAELRSGFVMRLP